MKTTLSVIAFLILAPLTGLAEDANYPGMNAPGSVTPDVAGKTGPIPLTGGVASPSGNNDSPKTVTVSALTNAPAVAAKYQVGGYVIWKSTCPPCPENAVCAPCVPPNIVISDTPQAGSLPGQALTVHAHDVESFKVGTHYIVTFARTLSDVNGGQQVHDKLIEAKEG